MTPIPFTGDARLRTAACTGTHWLAHCQLWRPTDPDQLTTGDHETAVILLGGTFDLIGGATAWPARGARKDEFTGRPMAVFLPKQTSFRTQNGAGELLLIAARQPEVSVQPSGRDAFARMPLLPLAGSGKSFDPNSGEWKPAETFPTAPESLPPRRFERLVVGACTIERIFAEQYKAATLCVDEVVLAAGQSLRLADVPGRPRCQEVCLVVRSKVTTRVTTARGVHDVRGDSVLVVPGHGDDVLVAAAADGPAYVVIAYAGKPAGSAS